MGKLGEGGGVGGGRRQREKGRGGRQRETGIGVKEK